MLVSLTVGKVDAGVTVLLTPDKRLIEFPSILLPPNISSGSIVDITVGRNSASESKAERSFRELQENIYSAFGASEPAVPVLRCRNATQTSVVLEWDPVDLATADLVSLSLYRNGQKAGNIPRPSQMHSTKISGLAVDTEYVFHLVLRTTAGTFSSERVHVRTHKLTDLSGITITPGILAAPQKESLAAAVERIGAKLADGVRIDTTHFVTTEGRGLAWEKAVENNIPVVTPEWVEACEKNGRILGVTKFYLDAVRPGPPLPSNEDPAAAQKELPAPPEQRQQQQQEQSQQQQREQQQEPETQSSAAEPSTSASEAAHGNEEETAEPEAVGARSNSPPGNREVTANQKEVGGEEEEDEEDDEGEAEGETQNQAVGETEPTPRSSDKDDDQSKSEEPQQKDLPIRTGGDAAADGSDDENDDKNSPAQNASSGRASFQNVEL